jgi:hypothetical protein
VRAKARFGACPDTAHFECGQVAAFEMVPRKALRHAHESANRFRAGKNVVGQCNSLAAIPLLDLRRVHKIIRVGGTAGVQFAASDFRACHL